MARVLVRMAGHLPGASCEDICAATLEDVFAQSNRSLAATVRFRRERGRLALAKDVLANGSPLFKIEAQAIAEELERPEAKASRSKESA